jgi:alkanesulfonate monooxygenase SsuD/methylene tetrahydromethanopterin reductase-like flavin-dependent oxidoreductase (luciferase family)
MLEIGAVSFGIKTSQANMSYADVLRVWEDADTTDAFQTAWLWDHLVPLRGPVTGPALEGWTLLAALAARTRRLRLGILVTSNRLRSPAMLAKMAATVDQVAGGRLVLGIGAGGSRVADPTGRTLVERELGAFGVEVVSPGHAIGALGEAIPLIKRLWSEAEPFDADGPYYRLRGAICEPKPVQRPRPPILVGTAGRRGLRIAAEHADMWVWPGDVDGFRRTSAALDEACAEIGREPAEIVRVAQVVFAAGQAAAPAGPGLVRRLDAAEARDHLLELIDAGARHLVLAPLVPAVDRPARLVEDEVVAPVLATLGHR